jgi:preprotein translocase subunit SecG
VSAIITIIHVIICAVLIVAVLLQSGKAADLAGAFGGVGSQTAFGPRGAATILSKVTTICAVLFMITSMGLWILSSKGQKSVVRGEPAGKAAAPAAATTEPKKEVTPATNPPAKPEVKPSSSTQTPSTQPISPPAQSQKSEPQKKEPAPQNKSKQ